MTGLCAVVEPPVVRNRDDSTPQSTPRPIFDAMRRARRGGVTPPGLAVRHQWA